MCGGGDGPAATGARGSSWGRRRGAIRGAAGVGLACALLLAGGQGGAGHQVGHYPSYYPDEIRIEAMSPADAAKGLADETVHAYVGATPSFAGPVPEHVKSARSLGSFLVLAFDGARQRFPSTDARCAAARGILGEIAKAKASGFVFHPYPVTPYHADYLHHLDLVEAATQAVSGGPAPAPPLQVAAKGKLAESLALTRAGSG